MSNAPSTRTSFGRGRADSGKKGERIDLGKPRFLMRESDGEITWLWCKRCGARRQPAAGGYAGGLLYVLKRGQDPSALLPRYRGVVPCDCELGEIRRQAMAASGYNPPALDRFKPEHLHGPHFIRAAARADSGIEIAGPFAGDPEADHEAGNNPKPEPDPDVEFDF